MEILDAAEACFLVNDDLLDFSLEDEAEEDDSSETLFKGGFASASASSSPSSFLTPAAAPFSHETRSGLFPEFVEEELEWLSNKDAFPSVDTCFGILSDNPDLIVNHHSHTSAAAGCSGFLKVSGKFPARPRSKRHRRKRDQKLWLSRLNVNPPSTVKGRRCLHCQAENTPQWRAGPMGPKTLCNACGVRYKSGRLVPEYRPANSPTFSSEMHSNSHRKVVEMRRHKYLGTLV